MAWEKGPTQEFRYDFSAKKINQEILDMEGYIPEDEARVLLYRFLRANIGFASELLLGIKLFPFQHILIKSMMIGDFSMFVLSRGMSKTFSAAIYVLLQLLFKQGIKIGVLSSGFRQAKMIFGKAEDILRKSGARPVRPLFGNNKAPITKGTDAWILRCGHSEAIALPLADGSRLRGFRFGVLLLDEFLNIQKQVFQEVILPFIGVVDNPTERADLAEAETRLIEMGEMKEEDRFVWPSNKLILLSSPSYTFEYMYEVYCLYRDRILGVSHEKDYEDASLAEESDYSIIVQLSYDMAPPTLYDKKQLKQAKQTMSEAVFAKEYGGQFISESDSYFKLSKMMACTIPIGESPHVQIKGLADKKYNCAIDPSWSQSSESDDFSFSVFELDDGGKDALVHGYAMAGQPMKNHIEYFLYLINNFNFEIVALDQAGGQQFVEACNASDLFKAANVELEIINEDIEGDFQKEEKYHEDMRGLKKHLGVKKNPNGHRVVKCYLRQFTSNWIREANEMLQADIDHKRIFFAAPCDERAMKSQTKADIPARKLNWRKPSISKKDKDLDARIDAINNAGGGAKSDSHARLEFLDYQNFIIELTKQQAANIEIRQTPQGTQTFQLPQHMARQTGPNRPRKDSYSTLFLGNWMNKIYHKAMATDDKPSVTETFIPMAF